MTTPSPIHASHLCGLSFAIALGLGCGGTTTVDPNKGPGPTTPVPETALQTIPIGTDQQIEEEFGKVPARSATDLSGVWDLVGARAGRQPEYGLLVIDSSMMVFADSWGNGVAVTGLPNAPAVRTYRRGQQHPISAQHAPAALSMGQLPVEAGGEWSLAAQAPGDRGACTGKILPAQISATCQGVSGVPRTLPGLNGTGSAIRVAQLDSIFGDLGGDWEVNGQNGHCTAKLNGNVFTATCDRSSGFGGGSITIVFGDGVASGTTSKGIEVAARRR
jgi:hypothetical protein